MLSFGNIVILHPAAIGDAMLATPVAAALKLNYPGAKITYWSHPVLRQLLLGLNPHVDEFIDFSKDVGFFQMVKQIEAMKPDLFVDLSNSGRLKFLPWFTRVPIVRYEKQKTDGHQMMHAVDNFLATIRHLCPEMPDPLFPSIFPEALASDVLDKLNADGNYSAQPLIALVPGVGKYRPHRAWLREGWIYLIRNLTERKQYRLLLVGGEDDADLCRSINEESGNVCVNVAGQLSLSETAAVLRRCIFAISGDTGPAHLAVAVGTPVIGLYGATYPERSGPYGYSVMTIDQSKACRCHGAKFCQVALPDGPGECMHRIMLPEVIEKIDLALGIENDNVIRD